MSDNATTQSDETGVPGGIRPSSNPVRDIEAFIRQYDGAFGGFRDFAQFISDVDYRNGTPYMQYLYAHSMYFAMYLANLPVNILQPNHVDASGAVMSRRNETPSDKTARDYDVARKSDEIKAKAENEETFGLPVSAVRNQKSVDTILRENEEYRKSLNGDAWKARIHTDTSRDDVMQQTQASADELVRHNVEVAGKSLPHHDDAESDASDEAVDADTGEIVDSSDQSKDEVGDEAIDDEDTDSVPQEGEPDYGAEEEEEPPSYFDDGVPRDDTEE